MELTEPGRSPDEEKKTIESLERDIEELRRRVAELEVPARRYRALFDGGIVSMQVHNQAGRTVEVNACFERLWHLRIEDLADYNLLTDPQVAAGGFTHLVERAFWQSEATRLPTIRYDPVETNTLQKGAARWVASSLHPIKEATGEVCEVLQIHVDVGELKQSEDELRHHTEELEAAVAARTAELEEQLRLSEEQQRAIAALSTPVLRIWRGILALPLIGRIDEGRARRLLDILLEAIVETGAEHVFLDLTGVPFIDAEGAHHLRDTVRAASLLGAQCVIVGISAGMARMLVESNLDFEGVPTFATLQEGLQRWLARHRESR